MNNFIIAWWKSKCIKKGVCCIAIILFAVLLRIRMTCLFVLYLYSVLPLLVANAFTRRELIADNKSYINLSTYSQLIKNANRSWAFPFQLYLLLSSYTLAFCLYCMPSYHKVLIPIFCSMFLYHLMQFLLQCHFL